MWPAHSALCSGFFVDTALMGLPIGRKQCFLSTRVGVGWHGRGRTDTAVTPEADRLVVQLMCTSLCFRCAESQLVTTTHSCVRLCQQVRTHSNAVVLLTTTHRFWATFLWPTVAKLTHVSPFGCTELQMLRCFKVLDSACGALLQHCMLSTLL